LEAHSAHAHLFLISQGEENWQVLRDGEGTLSVYLALAAHAHYRCAHVIGPSRAAKWLQGHFSLSGTTKERFVNHLMRGLALDRGHDLSHNVQATRVLHQCAPCRFRFALRWLVVDTGGTARLQANLDWLRNRAGGSLNSRLKARLKDCCDS